MGEKGGGVIKDRWEVYEEGIFLTAPGRMEKSTVGGREKIGWEPERAVDGKHREN